MEMCINTNLGRLWMGLHGLSMGFSLSLSRSRVTTRTPEKLVCRRTYQSLSEHPKDKSGIDASAKLTRAKLNKRSGDADLSKDKSGPELH
ncbi:hypothetical protein Tco_0547619 [Tanacetum coccineum]